MAHNPFRITSVERSSVRPLHESRPQSSTVPMDKLTVRAVSKSQAGLSSEASTSEAVAERLKSKK